MMPGSLTADSIGPHLPAGRIEWAVHAYYILGSANDVARRLAVGGGANHRMGLWDMALVKDNHIAAAGGIRAAVERVRERHPTLEIEVEVTSREELEEALSVGVERVMLDNMSIRELEESIRLCRSHRSSPEIEISGGVVCAELASLARLGADFISVGAITHSAPALDFSMELDVRA